MWISKKDLAAYQAGYREDCAKQINEADAQFVEHMAIEELKLVEARQTVHHQTRCIKSLEEQNDRLKYAKSQAHIEHLEELEAQIKRHDLTSSELVSAEMYTSRLNICNTAQAEEIEAMKLNESGAKDFFKKLKSSHAKAIKKLKAEIEQIYVDADDFAKGYRSTINELLEEIDRLTPKPDLPSCEVPGQEAAR